MGERRGSLYGVVAYLHIEFFGGGGFHAAVRGGTGNSMGPLFTATSAWEAEEPYAFVAGCHDIAVNVLLRGWVCTGQPKSTSPPRACVLSYGSDEASNRLLQAALLDSEILRALAAELTPALNRPQLNGVKVLLCRTPDSTTAEIRVNGEPAVLASEAMAARPWPDVAATTMARFYAVAVHPS